MRREHFELCELAAGSCVWIDVRVQDAKLTRSERDGCGHRESRAPRAFLPRKIETHHVGHRQAAQHGHASVTFIVQIDWFFKVEPPLTLDRLDAARNSRRRV